MGRRSSFWRAGVPTRRKASYVAGRTRPAEIAEPMGNTLHPGLPADQTDWTKAKAQANHKRPSRLGVSKRAKKNPKQTGDGQAP